MKNFQLLAAAVVAFPSTVAAQQTDESPARNATPANSPQRWVLPTDYPPQAILDESSGHTQVGVQVSIDGFPTDCTVVQTSGVASLDRTACDRIMERARFYPARNSAGEPIPGRYEMGVRWQMPDRPLVMPEAQFEAVFTLDETGELHDCQVVQAVNVPSEMKDEACPKGLDFQPLRDDNGVPTAKRIRFRLQITHEDIAD